MTTSLSLLPHVARTKRATHIGESQNPGDKQQKKGLFAGIAPGQTGGEL